MAVAVSFSIRPRFFVDAATATATPSTVRNFSLRTRQRVQNWLPLLSNSKIVRKETQKPLLQRQCRASSSVEMEIEADASSLTSTPKEKEEKMPWDGAIIFKRSSVQSHFEYWSTLERLGLFHLSTDSSKAKAAYTGLRVSGKAAAEHASGTPLHVAIDVSRTEKGELELCGLIRTFISLPCQRCGEIVVERVFSNFCLLLTNNPVNEAVEASVELDFGKHDQYRESSGDVDDDELDIYSDDQMYFPHEKKEIDLSKYIRDIVHLEDTLNAICDVNCKGICTDCGVNLNKKVCQCNNMHEDTVNPFEILREQTQKP
eukprot:TRINITY_DN11348_c0_g1_i1.p1 TRINITY_DN11348_c0_g1~~TRINITY_DN11348_c0_g1_i1.p1  ORF type:complete len:316 (-),score=34.61 TRINITY_DN11348_c0_g1_i1:468-1415(-)